MRLALFWNPGLVCERFAYQARQRRRLKKLRGTVAQGLAVGHIESLELLEATRPLGIRTIYDIGANVGTWSLLAKALIPEAMVEAFEPLAKHHKGFQDNLREVSDVTLHRIALGPENTKAALRVMDFSDASSMLPLAEASRAEFGLEEVEQIHVEVRRLDDYRTDLGLAYPDLIKLDVQGYELEVLKGATECLRQARALVIELSFTEYYEKQCLFHNMVSFLAGYGLCLEVLGEHTARASVLKQADALFLKKTGGAGSPLTDQHRRG